ncbi:probable receptor-like serine/threonine-protein kinase At5g57670, partial [Pistacia vera]|uniref:probable receptor-like serine/threonine-protein kinase At5g57670 n=1 Tax=Pistacia vera TaxID=55513 RepID=UPI0012637BCE
MVGQGGYSEVYKGNLSDGRTIAVKRLAKDNKSANKEKEFLMELGIIGHVCHPNTATLVGCCIENGLYLIFNFSQNGNLESALHGKRTKSLDWPVRYKIALGVARGLHYLHKCCKHRIIHRDIKASNVLLGPDYEPQIADFGLAKWLPNKWTHHAVIPIEGTFGYLAPEYFLNGIVDEKTDVFAFGVLLLEIITGRKPVDSSQQNLLLWAKPFMESGNITELIDPSLEDKYDSDQMHRLVLASAYCVRQSSAWRPSMSEVLELLTKGHDSEAAKNWRMPKCTSDSDELNDFSMFFGYHVPTDIDLEEFL